MNVIYQRCDNHMGNATFYCIGVEAEISETGISMDKFSCVGGRVLGPAGSGSEKNSISFHRHRYVIHSWSSPVAQVSRKLFCFIASSVQKMNNYIHNMSGSLIKKKKNQMYTSVKMDGVTMTH